MHAEHQPEQAEALREITAQEVETYLRAHPDFLADHPALFGQLAPPERLHGEGLADHMTAMVRAARARAALMSSQADEVLATSRAASRVAERVQSAVLALLRAGDSAECVAEALPGLLGVDAASLCCEGERRRWRTLPAGTVQMLLGGREMVARDRPADAALLHEEAAALAARDMLIRLPGTARPALLALASRDPACLPAAQSWLFLGRVLGQLYQRRTAVAWQLGLPLQA